MSETQKDGNTSQGVISTENLELSSLEKGLTVQQQAKRTQHTDSAFKGLKLQEMIDNLSENSSDDEEMSQNLDQQEEENEKDQKKQEQLEKKMRFRLQKYLKYKEMKQSIEKVKDEFSNFLSSQKQKKDQFKGTYNNLLMQYLIEELSEQDPKQQEIIKEILETETSEYNNKDEKKEIAQLQQQQYQKSITDDANKKKAIKKIEEVIRFDLGDVASRKRRKIENDLNLKMEQEILINKSITEEERQIKLENIKHSLVIDRVKEIITKSKKQKAEQAKSGISIEKGLDIFKNLDTFIETKHFWKQLNSNKSKKNLAPNTDRYIKKVDPITEGTITSKAQSRIALSKETSIEAKQVKNKEPASLKGVPSVVTEEPIQNVILKSQRYLDQKIKILSSTEKSIGGSLLKGLEQQYMSQRYLKGILDSKTPLPQKQISELKKYAPQIVDDSNQEQLEFYNQLNSQISFDFKKDKTSSKQNFHSMQNSFEEQMQAKNKNCQQIFEEYRTKAEKATQLLLQSSRNILKEKIQKMENENLKAKKQRQVELTKQHLNLKSIQHKIQQVKRKKYSEYESDDLPLDNNLKGDQKYSKNFTDFYDSPQTFSLLSGKNYDISQIPSLELQKQSLGSSIKMEKGMRTQKNMVSPLQQYQQQTIDTFNNNKTTGNSPKEIVSKKEEQSHEKRDSFSFMTQVTESNNALTLNSDPKKSEIEQIVQRPRYLSVVSKDPSLLIKAFQGIKENEEIQSPQDNISNKQSKEIKHKVQINLPSLENTPHPFNSDKKKSYPQTVQNQDLHKKENRIGSNSRYNSPSGAPISRNDLLVKAGVRIIQHTKKIEPSFMTQDSDTKNMQNYKQKQSLPNIASTFNSSPSMKTQNNSKQVTEEALELQQGLLKMISNFKRSYKEEKKGISEQIEDIQQGIENVAANHQPQQLESLRLCF